jgi:hypothetical protein
MNRDIVNETESDYPFIWDYAPIIYAFDNLPATDPLLDLFVDRHYMNWTSAIDSHEEKEWPTSCHAISSYGSSKEWGVSMEGNTVPRKAS